MLVAHDLQLISEVVDKVAVLEKGRIVRVGRTEQVLSDVDWLIEQGFNPLQPVVLARKIGLTEVVKTREIADDVVKKLKS